MANTYTQIHIQAVFSVQNRDCIINNSWKDELFKYITGIIQNHNHKLLAINGMPDHVHIFFGMRPTQSISDLMQQIEGDSSGWINEKKFMSSHFFWQDMELFLMVNRKQIRLLHNFKTRKNIIRKRLLLKNTKIF